MQRYRYRALSVSGADRRGFIEADSQEAARSILVARGESPVRLQRVRGMDRGTTLSRSALAEFLADLASLHDAGVPLRRALDVLSSEAASTQVAHVAKMMAGRLDAGASLGSAARLEGTGDLALAAELVRAGEASGRLGDTLRFAGQLLRRQAEFTSRLTGALAYPAFLLALSIGAIIALAVFAGPAIAPLLEDAPNSSNSLRLILGVGNSLRENGLAVLGAIVALSAAFAVASTRSPARELLAELRCRLPIAAQIVRDINCGAFARTLGALLAGGAPAAVALDLAASATPNSAWRLRLKAAAVRLREGRTVASAISTIPHASPELAQLARVGEASGALGQMLSRAGEIAIERALRRLDHVASIAGPALILAMGGFTGWLMSAFLTGLSQLGEGSL